MDILTIARFRASRRSRAVLALPLLAWLAAAPAADRPRPPDTRRDPVVETLHGVEIVDPYRWLEDQQAPETRAWIDAENRYTSAILDPLPGKDQIQRRLTELYRVDTISTPTLTAGRYFFTKRAADQDLAVIYVRKGLSGPDEVLVDPHPMSADHSVSVALLDVTRDGRTIAYGVRAGGEDELAVKLLDVDTRKDLPDSLPKARYSGISILPDRTGIYYSRQTKDGPRVFYHSMGTSPERDRVIFGDGYGPEKIIGAWVSYEGRYLGIAVYHGAAARKVELYVQDLPAESPIVPIVNDIEAEFEMSIAGDRAFLQTNWNAPNYRIMAVDLQSPARGNWREIVPEGKSPIATTTAAGGKLLVEYLDNVQSRVKVLGSDGALVREIVFPTIGSVGSLSANPVDDEAFFSFSSFAVPTTIYRYEPSSGRQDVWAKVNVPVKGEDVEVTQVWYTSKDGTRIPMFVAHRKGLRLDGRNPTLLTGYGGFNLSRVATFSQSAAFWIENGGVYALPNLRGGGEFGEAWHEAGMLEKKQNVFDDFFAAAEWLIANEYTSSAKLAISGGSNGGLLVGAGLTQRPDLFRAIVCSYPLLDMIRYHKFLVAGYWVPEYGSADVAADLKYLLAYSPYHNVKPGVKYPAVLFITGDGDTRVAPLHARKMAALLQASTGSDRPVLLKYDTKAGHSGGRPIRRVIDDSADEMRFLFWQLGVELESRRD